MHCRKYCGVLDCTPFFLLTVSLPKANLTKPRKLLNPKPSTKPKGVTTQMKALNEYVLMVVFTSLLNRLHVFANFMFKQQ